MVKVLYGLVEKPNDSSLVNGANSTDPNATCGIQRKLLSEFGSGSQHGALGSGTDPHPTSPSGIGTNILGKINNIWEHWTFRSKYLDICFR